jgi:hypothetical protein
MTSLPPARSACPLAGKMGKICETHQLGSMWLRTPLGLSMWPVPRDAWQPGNPPVQGGRARSRETRGGSGALPRWEVGSGVIGCTATPEPSSTWRLGPVLRDTRWCVTACPASYRSLELVCGVPSLQGTDRRGPTARPDDVSVTFEASGQGGSATKGGMHGGSSGGRRGVDPAATTRYGRGRASWRMVRAMPIGAWGGRAWEGGVENRRWRCGCHRRRHPGS